ncbi:MAG: glycosyltransferase, partial [Bosea sp. (in: a-proteobacteria)]
MTQSPLIILAAGGTGGHLFPAEALSHALKARGLRVVLVTDSRAAAYAGDFPAEAIHAVPSATPSGRGPLAIAAAGWKLLRGVMASRALIRKLKPAVVVGF